MKGETKKKGWKEFHVTRICFFFSLPVFGLGVAPKLLLLAEEIVVAILGPFFEGSNMSCLRSGMVSENRETHTHTHMYIYV